MSINYKSPLVFVILFCSFFLYFFGGTGWYEKSRLVLEGTTEGLSNEIGVQWDAGAGYNEYEYYLFRFLPFRSGQGNSVALSIINTGRANIQSSGNRVVLTEVRVDGAGVPVPKSSLRNVRFTSGKGWFLDNPESRVLLDVNAQEHIQVSLKTSSNAGTAEITINDYTTRFDLYRSNWEILQKQADFWLMDKDGQFKLTMDLPRYQIDTLKIFSSSMNEKRNGTRLLKVYLATRNQKVPVQFVQDATTGEWLVNNPLSAVHRYSHPLLLCFQLVFAGIATWGVFGLFQFAANSGGLRGVFLQEKRWLFWLLFGVALGCYGTWLAALWPGVMSVDSLNIWRAAWLPEVVINNHPIVNVVWYCFLQQLWNNPVIVPLSQILISSSLYAYIYCSVYRKGVSPLLLIICFLLVVTSVPISVYNVTLWKDIPFALLITYWAHLCALMWMEKREKGRVDISWQRLCAMLFLFLALVSCRHNGVLFLIVIPALLLFLGVLRVSRRSFLVLIGGIGLIVVLIVYPPAQFKGADYFRSLSREYFVKSLDRLDMTSTIKKTKSYPYILDIKKNADTSDFWHFYLGDRFAYEFLKGTGWNDSFSYSKSDGGAFPALKRAAMKTYWQSIDYPWVYFTWNPLYLILLLPGSIVLCRWMPLSAIYSTVVLAQVAGLLFLIETLNWRYYYFVLVAGYGLLPLLLLDIKNIRIRKKQQV